ncbi:hypothetical protein AH06_25 [Erwinia phage AH06]|nr:hypothetical protein AH06_25 [Erwinia phage AH06]
MSRIENQPYHIYQYKPAFGTALNRTLYEKPAINELLPESVKSDEEDSVAASRRIAMALAHQQDFLLLFKDRAKECTDGFDKWRMIETNNPFFEQTARQRLVGTAVEIYQSVSGEEVSEATKRELITWAETNKIIIINHVVGMQLFHRITNKTPADTLLEFTGGRRPGMESIMFSFKIPGAKHPYSM